MRAPAAFIDRRRLRSLALASTDEQCGARRPALMIRDNAPGRLHTRPPADRSLAPTLPELASVDCRSGSLSGFISHPRRRSNDGASGGHAPIVVCRVTRQAAIARVFAFASHENTRRRCAGNAASPPQSSHRATRAKKLGPASVLAHHRLAAHHRYLVCSRWAQSARRRRRSRRRVHL